MATNIELYEALKPTVGEDAARMIADVVPPARDLATGLDVERLRAEMVERFRAIEVELAEHRRVTDVRFEELKVELARHRGVTDVGFGELKVAVHAGSVSTTRWMLTFFVPLWLAMLAAVVTVGLRTL